MPNNKSSLHKGHRERLRNRFNINQGDDFSDHELLEMLLFYPISRTNTNELAHEMINEFGSLRNVFTADPSKVAMLDGAGKATSVFFSLLSAIRKRIAMQKYRSDRRFVADSLSKVGGYFLDYFKEKHREELCVMLLDNSFKLIDVRSVSVGSINSTSADIRSIARYALINDASYVIIAHNHPSGSVNASTSDNQVTFDLEAALHTVGISLMEHIVVNDVSYHPTMHMRALTPNCTEASNFYKKFYNN